MNIAIAFNEHIKGMLAESCVAPHALQFTYASLKLDELKESDTSQIAGLANRRTVGQRGCERCQRLPISAQAEERQTDVELDCGIRRRELGRGLKLFEGFCYLAVIQISGAEAIQFRRTGGITG